MLFRSNEIPGIAPDRRPYATIVLVLLGMAGCVLWRTGIGGMASNLIIVGKPGTEWWRLFTAAFTYDNTGYAFVTLFAIALYGWLLERRHGPLVVAALFLFGGVGGLAAAAGLYAEPVVLGAPGAALAMIVAWAVPDLISLSEKREIDGDLIGTAAVAVAVTLMPLAAPHATWVANVVGVVVGLGAGIPLARAVAR